MLCGDSAVTVPPYERQGRGPWERWMETGELLGKGGPHSIQEVEKPGGRLGSGDGMSLIEV